MAKKIGIDTVVLIYLFEEHPHYVKQAEQFLKSVEDGRVEAVFSSIGMIELLTGPKKRKQYELAARYRELLSNFPHLTITGINENIVELASDLRARYSISTPDAIHVACAIDFEAYIFVTNDKRLKKIKEIDIQILSETK